MTDLPEGRRGRLLAVALLLTVLASAWSGIAAPLLDWHAERDDQIARRSRLAARMAQVAAELPALRRAASGTDSEAPAASLQGASDSVAGAALQLRLQQIGVDAGAPLASTEVLPGEPLGAYRRIGVRVTVTAPWPAVVRLLETIGGNTPRLLVNDLQVQSTRGLSSDTDPLLNTGMVVFGFRAGSAS